MKNTIKKTLKWLTTARIATIPRKYLGRVITHIITNKRLMHHYDNPARAQARASIKSVKESTEMLLDDLQAYQIHLAVKKTEKIEGEIAEVGVYKGGSAKLICETTKKKKLHLFDTFEGLPDLTRHDSNKQFNKGEYSAQLEMVKESLEKYSNVFFYKGFFPATSGPVKNKKFSLVHLDVDIYESTLSCLTFFYPRMSRGGVIVSHDYPDAVGVKKAFDEFFEDKPEIIIELPLCDQCVVVKL